MCIIHDYIIHGHYFIHECFKSLNNKCNHIKYNFVLIRQTSKKISLDKMRSLLLQGFLVFSYHRDQYCVLRAFTSAVFRCRAINTRYAELVHPSLFVLNTNIVLDVFICILYRKV